jgi:hypothetical protein
MAVSKYLALDASGRIAEAAGVDASTGAPDAGKLLALDSDGKIDNSVLPTGVGAETLAVVASEALAAGDLVNVWNDSGTLKARKADASAVNAGKRAHGFVLDAYSQDDNATMYLPGQIITGLVGLTPGTTYFLSATPGGVTATPVTPSGQTLQEVGVSASDTSILFNPQEPIIRA